ncbi:MAG: DUF202 domain-containing protein [Burkholderiales bacterium]|nr:DUF202 domain-containing protein [Burkholderiales bacterium]
MSDLNDPRVFFAAERTLLAWNRTSLALMAFGFVIERFGLFVQMFQLTKGAAPPERGLSYWLGLAFILIGALSCLAANAQFRVVLRSLKPAEIPQGYRAHLGEYVNYAVAAMGIALTAYLLLQGAGT